MSDEEPNQSWADKIIEEYHWLDDDAIVVLLQEECAKQIAKFRTRWKKR